MVAEDMVADEGTVRELKELFNSPLREQHVRVMAAIFGKFLPSGDDLEKEHRDTVAV